MSNTIRIKRGKSNNLSVSNLQDGELALTLDTNKLYTNKGQISPDNVYVGDTDGKGFRSFKKGDDINGSDKLWNFIWV